MLSWRAGLPRSVAPPCPWWTSYACLRLPDGGHETAGYTEATRGCKHLCRHCPIVPVYGGRFRVVQRDVVLEDIASQIAAGARHVTFGDPDFFNGPAHAVAVVLTLHDRFPNVTYDVTVKIEHLVQQARHLPVLRDTGCLFITSAVEAFDDHVLEIFDKRHSSQDFVSALRLLRDLGIAMNPTFVAFTPWTTLDAYADFLLTIHRLDLVGNVAPVQYAIRLLIPEGSYLLKVPGLDAFLDGFDAEALCYRWVHPDPRGVVLFLADRTASRSVVDDWCPLVNFFEHAEAASAWSAARGVAGAVVPVTAEATDRAADMWRPRIARRRTDPDAG